MKRQRLLPLLATAACALGAAPAAAAATEVQQASSENWSGYVVRNSGSTTYSSVTGSWVQPAARCTGATGDSAFWVGLGGADQTEALEQAGTEADCNTSGQPTYFAWYELVPSAPVRLDMTIQPGDHVTSTVTVNGDQVRIALTDQTSGRSANRTLTMSDPDTSSAEWIAEAPSQCSGSVSNCQPLPLTDFGTVTFRNAHATTTDGHTGTISDGDWSADAVSLNGSGSSGYGAAQFTSQDTTAGATPSGLSSDGSAFSVTWSDSTGSSTAGVGSSAGSDGSGYPDGGGYGTGGYGPGGYGPGGYGSSYGSGGGDGYGGAYGYGYGYGVY